jgi:hypothetical protein
MTATLPSGGSSSLLHIQFLENIQACCFKFIQTLALCLDLHIYNLMELESLAIRWIKVIHEICNLRCWTYSFFMHLTTRCNSYECLLGFAVIWLINKPCWFHQKLLVLPIYFSGFKPDQYLFWSTNTYCNNLLISTFPKFRSSFSWKLCVLLLVTFCIVNQQH